MASGKKKCAKGHVMVMILPELWLCEDASWGRLSYMMGAVETARVLVERSGGIAAMRDQVDRAEAEAKARRKLSRMPIRPARQDGAA